MTDRLCAVDGCDQPMPTGDQSTACPGHWNRLERHLAEMPVLVDELNTAIVKQARITLTSTGRPAPEPRDEHDGLGVHEQPLPFNLGASDALELLHRTLWPWVREGIEAHPDAFPHALDPSTVGLSRVLLRLHGWLQGHPDGNLAIDEITYAVRTANRAIDRGADLDYAGPCGAAIEGESCPEDLYVAHDAVLARCRTCGTEWDVPERRAALLVVAEDQLVTTTEACRAVKTYAGEHLTSAMVRGWKARGRLTAHPDPRDGKDRWRLGDVLDLVAGHAQGATR